MRAFNYSCPTDLAEAVKLLRAEPDAKLVAGGQTLLASLKLRLAAPSRLVDLRLVPKLQTISGNDKEIEIGAMSRHADVAVSPIVAARIPALARLAGGIENEAGSPRCAGAPAPGLIVIRLHSTSLIRERQRPFHSRL